MLKNHPHLASFLELTPDAVILVNIDGKILYVNRDLYDMFNYDADQNELIGQQLEILLPPQYRHIHIEHRRRFFAAPTKRPMGTGKPLTAMKKGNVEFSVEISLSHLVLSETGTDEVVGMAIIRDLTERLYEKNKLQTNLEGILEAAPDGIVMINSHGDMVLVNGRMQQLFGYEKSEMLNRPIEMLIPERYRRVHTVHRKHYFDKPATRAMGVGKELVGKRKDNLEWPVEISLSPIVLNAELCAIAIVRDITVKKAFEHQLIEAREKATNASNAKSDFIANISHEIRTPLNGIVGLADILLRTELDSEQRNCVVSLKQCADSLVFIINDILDFSTIELDRFMFHSTTFDVHAFIKEIEEFVKVLAMDKFIIIEFTNALPHVHVTADMERIRQVCHHLINNAFKFTERGTIRVRFDVVSRLPETQDTLDIKFTVTDTGIGIPDNKKKGLFTLFNPLDDSTTKRYPGTGVGLVLSKKLIQLMGGDIDYTSKPGQGSSFWFHVPLKKAIVKDDGTSASTRSTGSDDVSALVFPHNAILIVEDNPIHLHITKKIVEKFGCRVDTAVDGLQAVSKCREHTYDFIFMDIQMPNMDGFQATEKLREMHVTCPIVALTAGVFQSDVDKCLEVGMNDHLAKPATRKMIENMVHKWVK